MARGHPVSGVAWGLYREIQKAGPAGVDRAEPGGSGAGGRRSAMALAAG